MPLNGKQKRQLRALGHHLKVVVQVGAEGVTDGVIGATVQALEDHELIKVKFAEEDRDGRVAAIDALASGSGSEVAQSLGRTVLLFRKRKKKSKFELNQGGLTLVTEPEPEAKGSKAKSKARPARPAPRKRRPPTD